MEPFEVVCIDDKSHGWPTSAEPTPKHNDIDTVICIGKDGDTPVYQLKRYQIEKINGNWLAFECSHFIPLSALENAGVDEAALKKEKYFFVIGDKRIECKGGSLNPEEINITKRRE